MEELVACADNKACDGQLGELLLAKQVNVLVLAPHLSIGKM